jgi:hypothetical protein
MRSHILLAGFAALALIMANTLPSTANPRNEPAGVNTAKSARHVDYRLIGSHTGNTHGQHRVVVAGHYDDGGDK